MLVDDNEEALKNMKEKLEEAGTNVQSESIVFDFKKKMEWQEYEELCKRIKDITKEKEISILINNVEQYDPYGMKIHKADDEEVLETLTANTYPMVFMTRFLGPDMK